MRYITKATLLILITLTACKSKKTISDSALESLSVKKIVSNHYENEFNRKTVYAKLNTRYLDRRSSLKLSIKMRLEKDKTIWLSATKLGIPVAKLLITPKRVQYYEKIQRVYFDGDYALLNKWLKTELDFFKLQNLLLGQAVNDLKKGKYTAESAQASYQLTPRKNGDLYKILFFMNPENFKLNKQVVRDTEKQQEFTVAYPNYSRIEEEHFPQKILITAVDSKNRTQINIEYRSVEFDRELTFPFSIPSKYKEIKLK
jgi:hypothetical protein